MMRRRIENWLLRNLLNALTAQEVVSNDPKTGALVIDGIPITPNELSQLHAEIKAMEGFRIWRLVSETVKRDAETRIFKSSETMDDIRFGKAMLYNLALQHSIIHAVRSKKL